MNHGTLSKATAFVALACAWLATQHSFGQRQELTRIQPPSEERAAAQPAPTYYQPSIYRFAEYSETQSEYEQVTAEAAQPPAPLAANEPAYGAGNDYNLGNYSGNCCCGLTGFVGIESTFLFPVIQDGPASVQIEENGGPDPLYTTGEAELDDNMFFSPRIWAGAQYCGWGVVARVWWLDGADSVFAPETPFFAQSHVVNARLEAYTADLEGFHTWYKDDCCLDQRYISAGFRYANWEADELVEAHAVVGGDYVQGLAHTVRNFDGPGGTFAYGGTHGFQGCQCLRMFFNLRGSFMFGDVYKAAQTTAWAFDPSIVPGTAVNYSTAVVQTTDTAFIGEVQLGMQFEQPLACCCGRFFLRSALEFQYWNADGGYAAAGSQAFTNDAIVTSLATADDFEMNLIGLTIGTGLMY